MEKDNTSKEERNKADILENGRIERDQKPEIIKNNEEITEKEKENENENKDSINLEGQQNIPSEKVQLETKKAGINENE